MWSLLGAFILALGVVALTHWVYKWRNPKCNGVLPPGSMGLPLIGETFQFFATSKSVDISPFIKTRINKYGRVFKTSLVGRPVVVSTDHELNHYIFQEEGKLVEMWYMDTFANVLGLTGSAKLGLVPTNSTGYIHKFIRNTILSQIGIEKIKESILTQFEDLSRETVRAWASASGTIELKSASTMMVTDFAANLLFGYETKKSQENNMRESLDPILQGLMSFPLNIPGTTYHKCMKNQKSMLRAMKGLMEERLASPEKRRGDLLDHFLDGMKTESFLTEDFVLYAMLAVLIATYETISGIICIAIIYLSDNPKAVKQLEKEQDEILQNRKDNGQESKLSWKEYKSMTFTTNVVKESLRMANSAPALMRRAIKDIHVNGYTIPKGWTIMIAGSAFHMNPETYHDPLSFNPWRWDDLSSSTVAKNYMPFGWGMRTCVGSEYATALVVAFLHVFVSNYKWEKVKGGEIIRNPFLSFGQGVHIKVLKKDVMHMHDSTLQEK